MELRVFSAGDWPWVQDWFRDPILDRELGPMDTDWLDAVLSERDGVQLVAIIQARPVALVGCVWGHQPDGLHGVTDVAVAPGMQRRGIGSRALDLVLEWPGHPPSRGWMAVVNPLNVVARSFLTKQGWQEGAPQEGGMIRFEKHCPLGPMPEEEFLVTTIPT